jgi:uncharacterized membrane protein
MTMRTAARQKKGVITVIFAAGMVTFLGMLAITVDVGFFYATKAKLQTAADIALVTGFAQVKPYDAFEKQERTLRQAIEQFQRVNFGPEGEMGIISTEKGKESWDVFQVTAYMDPSTKCLSKADIRCSLTVDTAFARVFGQDRVDIGVMAAVEGLRAQRQGLHVMSVHLVD